MRWDSREAECVVFVEREGVLRRIGHDVKLTVTRFWIDVEPDRIEASFDASSLEVAAAIVDAREEPSLFSERDKSTIAEHIKSDVLDARRFPTITFLSRSVQKEDDACTMVGELHLCGVKRSLTLRATRSADRWVAEHAVHQPDFGIRPFSAMLGALKVKPAVRVRLTVPIG